MLLSCRRDSCCRTSSLPTSPSTVGPRCPRRKAEISQEKRRSVIGRERVGAAIKNDREKHERQLQAYESMCLDNL